MVACPYCTVSAPIWKVCAVVSWFFTVPLTANGGVAGVVFFSMKLAAMMPSPATRP